MASSSKKCPNPPLHCGIAKALYDRFLTTIPSGFVVRKDDPLTLADSEPEPDLAVIRGELGEFATRHPSTAALVIEVAVSSAAEDRSLASLFAEVGVQEYWTVLPAQRRVEVYRGIEGGTYRDRSIVEGDTTLECTAVRGVRVALGDLFGK